MQRIYAEVIESEFPEGERECPMSEEEFKQALDPREILRRRQTSGSANPQEVKRMISALTDEVQAFVQWREDQQKAIDTAIANLDQEFQSFLI